MWLRAGWQERRAGVQIHQERSGQLAQVHQQTKRTHGRSCKRRQLAHSKTDTLKYSCEGLDTLMQSSFQLGYPESSRRHYLPAHRDLAGEGEELPDELVQREAHHHVQILPGRHPDVL